MAPDKTFNAAEVMRILRVTRSTVRSMLQRGDLRGFQRGRIIRIDRKSVEQLIRGARSVTRAAARAIER